MLSNVTCGSGSPAEAMPAMPHCCTSQSNGAPSASSTFIVAATISGPIPSPGIRVAGILLLAGATVMGWFQAGAAAGL